MQLRKLGQLYHSTKNSLIFSKFKLNNFIHKTVNKFLFIRNNNIKIVF